MSELVLSDEGRILAGILLLSLVTVETGGVYLVRLWQRGGVTEFQAGFARAGHAHAGVLLILGLLCQPLADAADLPVGWDWAARSGVPIAAILMPAGFFLSSMGRGRERPNRLVALVYAGGLVLALGLSVLGVGLLVA
ncbi:hypothetical protein IE331_06815 [Nocardioides sp. MJB4]|uniref:Uncharacterized protein n=2 Tax=Nocardioides donggukensis TaxID=2774019 RepID=A0A927K562_9ACTN|nr:hypothetical protein [Nocardioides donggukensis]